MSAAARRQRHLRRPGEPDRQAVLALHIHLSVAQARHLRLPRQRGASRRTPGAAMSGVGTRTGELWVPGPARPRLGVGSVHVWRAELSEVPEQALGWLSADERARAARFPHGPASARWARARGALRELLARYLDLEPAEVALRAAGNGKPILAVPSAPPLAFNVSHSGELALYAFAASAAVGVDVQVPPSRHLDVAAI